MTTAKEFADYIFNSLFVVIDILSYKQKLVLDLPENITGVWTWYHDKNILNICYNNDDNDQYIFICYKESKLIEFFDRKDFSDFELEIIFALKDNLKNYLDVPIQTYSFF